MVIVSSCLLGKNCKYDGGNNKNQRVISFVDGKNYVEICPECLGNLPIPRVPSEQRDGRVYSKTGEDVTENFVNGAKKAVDIAQTKAKELGEDIELAILKSKSPSCGVGEIYDGSFTKKLVGGNGIFAQRLIDQGVKTITEKELDDGKF